MPVNKKTNKGLETSFITHIDLDEFGRRKKITLQTELHDSPEAIKAHLDAFSGDALTPVIFATARGGFLILGVHSPIAPLRLVDIQSATFAFGPINRV